MCAATSFFDMYLEKSSIRCHSWIVEAVSGLAEVGDICG